MPSARLLTVGQSASLYHLSPAPKRDGGVWPTALLRNEKMRGISGRGLN